MSTLDVLRATFETGLGIGDMTADTVVSNILVCRWSSERARQPGNQPVSQSASQPNTVQRSESEGGDFLVRKISGLFG